MQVHALERGQTVWSLLRGLFSQTSRSWWLTFGTRVTHPCFSFNPETITESHSTLATDTPSLPAVQQCTDDTLCLSHLSQTAYFQGKSFLSINLSDVSVNNTNGSVGRWCSNYPTFVRLLTVLLISIFYSQSLLCDKLHSAVLSSLSEVIKSYFNVMCEWVRPDSSDILFFENIL